MKYYIDKKLFSQKKNILKKINLIKNDKLIINLLINRIIFLNLKLEKIQFNHSLKQENPNIIVKKEIENFYNFISDINNFNEFSKKIKVKKGFFKREKSHKKLFNMLWTNYSFKEYKKERLGRYINRIKINNLSNLIRNKKIVDLGCGHGNFLLSCSYFKAKECVGIDHGTDSIKFAKNIKRKIFPDKKISFFNRTVYKTKLKSNYFDFAIQNGVFHHLDNEEKSYSEVYRVLKKNGFFWVYTDGGGGLRDFIFDLSQKILSKFDNSLIQQHIRFLGLSNNKEYHLGDSLSAEYRHSDLRTMKRKLEKIGFKFIRQLNGGEKTDFDYPFKKVKWFREKFGSGDLRLLFKKI